MDKEALGVFNLKINGVNKGCQLVSHFNRGMTHTVWVIPYDNKNVELSEFEKFAFFKVKFICESLQFLFHLCLNLVMKQFNYTKHFRWISRLYKIRKFLKSKMVIFIDQVWYFKLSCRLFSTDLKILLLSNLWQPKIVKQTCIKMVWKLETKMFC